jgi:ATP-binding protein involved in chromosome partitioning
MSAFFAPDGTRHAVFGSGGGAALAAEISAPLLGEIPIESAVSEGGDSGRPIALGEPSSPAGAAFVALAERIVADVLPPIEMAGCTARILDVAAANLAARDAARPASRRS